MAYIASYVLDYSAIVRHPLHCQESKAKDIVKELIIPTATEVMKSVVHYKTYQEIIAAIPLTNNTGQRRIDEMVSNVVEAQLYSEMRNYKFRIQLDDESTLPSNDSLLS